MGSPALRRNLCPGAQVSKSLAMRYSGLFVLLIVGVLNLAGWAYMNRAPGAR